jgi:coenzyme F420-0:L-glutamate ligase/coenzyme F420-1:gamma-L-glutamate ligase
MSDTLTLTALPGVPQIEAGADLCDAILGGLARARHELQAGDVVVLAQKIVSKAEGRLVMLSTVTPSPAARELAAAGDKDPRVAELILAESAEVVRVRPGVVIVAHRLGFVMANAGIDHSNIGGVDDDRVLLLPEDPDASSARIREGLLARTGVDVGVLIIDSIGRAWRNGTVGQALGLSGLPGLLDLKGRPDLHGRALQTSELGLADELASAASLVMGQADEGRPIVLARGLPYARREGTAQELVRPKEKDMFR